MFVVATMSSLLQWDLGQQQWVQPMWDWLDTNQWHQDWTPSWLPVSQLGAATRSQGSGEGFYSNSCHSLPILDVN